MTDFTDLEAAEREYIPELEEVVKKALGADHVIAWGPIIRRASAVITDSDQPVGNNVHVDFTTARWASNLGPNFLARTGRNNIRVCSSCPIGAVLVPHRRTGP
jgi:hypothetical protein